VAQIKKKLSLSWPNVFLSEGWDDAQRLFNSSGYGQVLVGPDGVVRGVGLHGQELEKAVEQLRASEGPSIQDK
jgi:hypothetical protein